MVEKYNCSKEMSEVQFCKNMGLYQVFDCGNKKYVWKNEK